MGEESTRAQADPLAGRTSRRTTIQMVAVGLIASVVGIALGLVIDWFPTSASKQAGPIDTLWDVLIICSVPVFVLVTTVVLFAVRQFRMRPGQEQLDGPPIHGNTRLEVLWTAVPAMLLVSLCTYAYLVLHDIEKAPAATAGAHERVIGVQGQQFAWTFFYDEGGKRFTSGQLYVPEGESVRFNVTTKDVIHDFWVPAWRVKIDAVPGITTRYRVTPTRVGSYPVVCAELCGLGHAFMRNTAHVLPKAQFAAWVKRMTQPAASTGGGGAAAPAVDAKKLFTQGNQTGAPACGSCHHLADAGTTGGVGPDLDKVLKGQSAAFIRQSILDPNAKIAKGFSADIMPGNFSQLLSKPEVDALVKYLQEVAAK